MKALPPAQPQKLLTAKPRYASCNILAHDLEPDTFHHSRQYAEVQHEISKRKIAIIAAEIRQVLSTTVLTVSFEEY